MKKSISLFLTGSLSLSLLSPVFAAELPNGSMGETIDHIAPDDSMSESSAEIVVNEGTIGMNVGGTVDTNHGTISHNMDVFDPHDPDTILHQGIIGYNDGTIENNHAKIIHIDEGGLVKNNYGTIDQNMWGTVEENHGIIGESSYGLVNNNSDDGTILTLDHGTVEQNDGTITQNENGNININNGTVDANKGQVGENDSDGVITENYGWVGKNSGTILSMRAQDDLDYPTGVSLNDGGTIEAIYGGEVLFNAGTIGTIYDGTVTDNVGTIDTNKGTISANMREADPNDHDTIISLGTIRYNEGTIEKNGALISNNAGVVVNNSSTGTIKTSRGTVEENNGTIASNSGSSAIVTVNNGSINRNWSTVQTNFGSIDLNMPGITDIDGNKSDGVVNDNQGIISQNTSLIEVNGANGKVSKNSGKGIIKENNGLVNQNVVSYTTAADGTTTENIAVIEQNNGTVSENQAKIAVNGESGVVKVNSSDGTIGFSTGTVEENNGNIDDNRESGVVKVNNGSVGVNTATVQQNLGSIHLNKPFNDTEGGLKRGVVNDNQGVIDFNESLIEVNGANGKVINNLDTIQENNGLVNSNVNIIQENNGRVDQNTVKYTTNPDGTTEMIGGVIEQNNGTVSANTAKIEINGADGYVDGNRGDGVIEINNGTVHANMGEGVAIDGVPLNDHAAIGTNNGTLEINAGDVAVNAENGTVIDNYGTVAVNRGTIETNQQEESRKFNAGMTSYEEYELETGVVQDNEGTIQSNEGTVEANEGLIKENSGTVDNNSGEVTKNLIVGEVTDVGAGTVGANYGTEHLADGVTTQYGVELVNTVDGASILQQFIKDAAAKAIGTLYVREGYDLVGYAYDENAENADYEAETGYTFTAPARLYSIWKLSGGGSPDGGTGGSPSGPIEPGEPSEPGGEYTGWDLPYNRPDEKKPSLGFTRNGDDEDPITPSITTIENIDQLTPEEAEEFQRAYDEAMSRTDIIIIAIFWMGKADGIDLAYYMHFMTEYYGVGVNVNSNPMNLATHGNGEYVAELTEFGTVLIYAPVQ